MNYLRRSARISRLEMISNDEVRIRMHARETIIDKTEKIRLKCQKNNGQKIFIRGTHKERARESDPIAYHEVSYEGMKSGRIGRLRSRVLEEGNGNDIQVMYRNILFNELLGNCYDMREISNPLDQWVSSFQLLRTSVSSTATILEWLPSRSKSF